jgi:hypothetical protein
MPEGFFEAMTRKFAPALQVVHCGNIGNCAGELQLSALRELNRTNAALQMRRGDGRARRRRQPIQRVDFAPGVSVGKSSAHRALYLVFSHLGSNHDLGFDGHARPHLGVDFCDSCHANCGDNGVGHRIVDLIGLPLHFLLY